VERKRELIDREHRAQERARVKRDDWIGSDVSARHAGIDAAALEGDLEAQGWSVLPDLLTSAECEDVASLYGQDECFRSRVVMARHGFGKGEYRYFSYPLPPLVQSLRTALYPRLAPLANRWHERMGVSVRFPAEHAEFIARCTASGSRGPRRFLLQYGAGDYNCLHQDLYGEHVFPLQLAVLLSEPGQTSAAASCVLTEQRPRMQTRVAVVPLTKGDAVVFAVNTRPVRRRHAATTA
jgi:hypothetical protein